MPTYKGKPIICEQVIQTGKNAWQLSQLQLFLHDIQFKTNHGEWQKAQIISPENSSQEVVLLGGYCGQKMKWQFKVKTRNAAQNTIKFTIGVPFELNHLNPLTQPHPLNQSDMFWTWQTGYKFLRMEMASQNDEWIFHLGSTGCDSPSPVRPPRTACKNPNRASVELSGFSEKSIIAVEIDKLLEGMDLVKHSECQSGENNEVCKILLPRIGVGGQQQVFSLR